MWRAIVVVNAEAKRHLDRPVVQGSVVLLMAGSQLQHTQRQRVQYQALVLLGSTLCCPQVSFLAEVATAHDNNLVLLSNYLSQGCLVAECLLWLGV